MRTRLKPVRRLAFAALCLVAALSSLPAIGAQHAQARPGPVSGVDQWPPEVDPQRPPAARPGQSIIGRATRIHDGDSFAMLAADGRRLTIRISGIDAPEKGQPFADRSRQHLVELIADRDIAIAPVKTDMYGRIVAVVHAGELDVGLAQVRSGMAWHFRRYARDQSPAHRQAYARAESVARDARIGLWRDRSPLEPWRYREQQRNKKDRPVSHQAAGAADRRPCPRA